MLGYEAYEIKVKKYIQSIPLFIYLLLQKHLANTQVSIFNRKFKLMNVNLANHMSIFFVIKNRNKDYTHYLIKGEFGSAFCKSA